MGQGHPSLSTQCPRRDEKWKEIQGERSISALKKVIEVPENENELENKKGKWNKTQEANQKRRKKTRNREVCWRKCPCYSCGRAGPWSSLAPDHCFPARPPKSKFIWVWHHVWLLRETRRARRDIGYGMGKGSRSCSCSVLAPSLTAREQRRLGKKGSWEQSCAGQGEGGRREKKKKKRERAGWRGGELNWFMLWSAFHSPSLLLYPACLYHLSLLVMVLEGLKYPEISCHSSPLFHGTTNAWLFLSCYRGTKFSPQVASPLKGEFHLSSINSNILLLEKNTGPSSLQLTLLQQFWTGPTQMPEMQVATESLVATESSLFPTPHNLATLRYF